MEQLSTHVCNYVKTRVARNRSLLKAAKFTRSLDVPFAMVPRHYDKHRGRVAIQGGSNTESELGGGRQWIRSATFPKWIVDGELQNWPKSDVG
jgi:hypothetical protein